MDGIDVLLVVLLIIVLIIIVLAAGINLGENTFSNAVCKKSGYDGTRKIDGVNYCYTGSGENIVFVPLVVASPQAE